MAENGGEFANEKLADMCENVNIRNMHTAAQSPGTKGLYERKHAMIDEMVRKIVADQSKCPCMGCHAKNCLQMVGGYNSYQIVFGKTPTLHYVINNSLPPLGGTIISETLGKHLNALHANRQAFIATAPSESTMCALRHQVRPTYRM